MRSEFDLPSGLSLPVVTPSGSFTWGTISTPTEKTLSLASASGPTPAMAKISFSGDTAYFEITEIEGQVLSSPLRCDLASESVRDIAWASGTTTTIKIRPRFHPAGASTMSLVVSDATGAALATYSATADYSDAFVGACVANASCMGVWSAMNLAAGNLATGATALTDVSGKGAPSYQTVLSVTGYQKIESDALGTNPSLAKKLTVDQRGTTNYAALTDYLASSAEAGLIVMKRSPAPSNWFEVWSEGGKVGSIRPSSEFCVFMDSNVGFNVSGGSGKAAIAVGTWNAIVFAWRRSGGTTYTYLSGAAGAWKDRGSASDATAWTGQKGGNIGSRGDANEDISIYAITTFSSDIGEAALQTIMEAVA